MISKFKKILVELLGYEETPTHVVTVGNDGLLKKSPYPTATNAIGNIDGGFANSVYLASQNTDGGYANITGAPIINGGNAIN